MNTTIKINSTVVSNRYRDLMFYDTPIVHNSDVDSKRLDFLLLNNHWWHGFSYDNSLLIPMRYNLPLPQET